LLREAARLAMTEGKIRPAVMMKGREDKGSFKF
jgi:hypothetical protein